MVAHTCILGSQKVGAGELWLWGYHRLYGELPPQTVYLGIANHLKPKAQVKRRLEKKQRGRVMCLNLGGVSGIDKGLQILGGKGWPRIHRPSLPCATQHQPVFAHPLTSVPVVWDEASVGQLKHYSNVEPEKTNKQKPANQKLKHSFSEEQAEQKMSLNKLPWLGGGVILKRLLKAGIKWNCHSRPSVACRNCLTAFLNSKTQSSQLLFCSHRSVPGSHGNLNSRPKWQ